MTSFVNPIYPSINGFGNKLLRIFSGRILPVVVLALIMIIFSRKLSYHDYGQFQTIWIYCNILSVVISFGISTLLLSTQFTTFVYLLERLKYPLVLFFTSWILILFIIFYFSVVQIPTSTKLLMIPFILLQCVCTIIDTLLIKKNLLKLYVWVNFIYTLIFFAIHGYFFLANFVLNQLIVAVICLAALKIATLFFLPVSTNANSINYQQNNLVTNWFFIGLNEISGVLARWLDKIVVLFLLSPAEFAVFFNGAIEIPLFAILMSTVEYGLLTNISAHIYDRIQAKKLYRESFKILSLIAFPLFFFLLTMHAEAFSLLFNNKYNASVPIFLITIFIIPLRITHYGVILQCYGQSKKVTFGSVADITLSLLLMLLLYPIFGTAGIALAIVLSTYAQAAYYLWQTSLLMQLKISQLIPVTYLLKLFFSLAAFYGLFYAIKIHFTVLPYFIFMLILTIFVIVIGSFIHWRFNQHQIRKWPSA